MAFSQNPFSKARGSDHSSTDKENNPNQTSETGFNSPSPICPHKEACQLGKMASANTQRRVTFHLPDGSQESCSDSGLGDQEPSSTASTATQPLPLGFPQDPYYEQASPSSRTEGDGNSDPESTMEVNLQKALAEASENCTQECLILGHSDSCWMPPALAHFHSPGNSSTSPASTPPSATSHSTSATDTHTTSPVAAINTTQGTQSGTLSSFGFQSWSRGGKDSLSSMGGLMDGRHTLGRSVPRKEEQDKGLGGARFYSTLDRHHSKKEEPVKVIPLASFSSSGQQQHGCSGGSGNFLHEHQL